jgi:hypothetical protein
VDHPTLVLLAAALSLVPLPLLLWCVRPKTALWICLPAGLGAAAFAVGIFWLWQQLEQPFLAYLDAIVYGSLALLAVLVQINKWLGRSDARRASGSQARRVDL